jgi:hypothetical protein
VFLTSRHIHGLYTHPYCRPQALTLIYTATLQPYCSTMLVSPRLIVFTHANPNYQLWLIQNVVVDSQMLVTYNCNFETVCCITCDLIFMTANVLQVMGNVRKKSYALETALAPLHAEWLTGQKAQTLECYLIFATCVRWRETYPSFLYVRYKYARNLLIC